MSIFTKVGDPMGRRRSTNPLISITAEYALRAVVYLARDCERARTTRHVADATQVPVSYLSKVLQALVRSRIVRSVRGIHGGYQLSRDPRQCTALEVINCVDPIERIRGCPLGLHRHATGLCPLHRRLDAAIGLAEQAFAMTTIDQLVEQVAEGATCAFPVNDSLENPFKLGGPADKRADAKPIRRKTTRSGRSNHRGQRAS